MEGRSLESNREKWHRLRVLTASGSALVLVAFFFVFSMMTGAGDEVKTTLAVEEEIPVAQQPTDAIQQFRDERELIREEEVKQIRAVLSGEPADEVKAAAQQQLLKLMDWMEKESTIEGILKARGNEGALVTVHTDSVNVLIRTQDVSQQDSAVILDLVLRETGVTGGNIKIIPIGG